VTGACKGLHDKGEPCGQAPLVDADFCFWHRPDYERQAPPAEKPACSREATAHRLERDARKGLIPNRRNTRNAEIGEAYGA